MEQIWRQLNRRPVNGGDDGSASTNLFSPSSLKTAPESCTILGNMHEFDASPAKIAPI